MKEWAFFTKYNFNERLVLIVLFAVFSPMPLAIFANSNYLVFQIISTVLCGVAVGLVSLVILFNKNTRSLVLHSPYSWCAFPILGISFLSCFIFHNWLGLAVTALIFFIFVFIFFVRSIINYIFFNNMLNIIIGLSIIPAIIGILQKYYILHYLYPNKLPARFEGRVYSTFANPNFYAYIINLVIIIIIYRLIILNKTNSNDKYRMFYYFSVLALNFIALILTNCRSSLITLLIGILIITALHKKFLLSAGLLTIYMSYFLFIKLLPGIFPRMDLILLDTSFEERLAIWSNALSGIKSSPFIGQGFFAYLNRFSDKVHAHNLLFDILLSSGIVGLSFYILYFFKNIKESFSLLKSTIGKTILIFLFAFLTITILHGITDVPILGIQSGILFGILLSGFGIKLEELE